MLWLPIICTRRKVKWILLFKIDFEKAYDRVNWEFLKLTLEYFGFPHQIISLILNCISSWTYTLKWNNTILDGFTQQRGPRQGDLLSPYLLFAWKTCFIDLGKDSKWWCLATNSNFQTWSNYLSSFLYWWLSLFCESYLCPSKIGEGYYLTILSSLRFENQSSKVFFHGGQRIFLIGRLPSSPLLLYLSTPQI